MQSEDIDKLFRDQLRDHAPAPPAFLWDQLEAELRPAKKRPVLWLYAAAAVVALLLVAGGSWLWQTPGADSLSGSMAGRHSAPAAAKMGRPAVPTPALATPPVAAPAEKTLVAQATARAAAPSTPSEANRADQLNAAHLPYASAPTPRPAAHRTDLAAEAGANRHPAAGTRPVAPAPEAGRPQPATQALAATTARPEHPAPVVPTPASPAEPAAVAQAAAAPTPPGTFEVEVHRGSARPAAALAAAPADEHGLMDRLLRQAGKVALREVREKVEVPVLTLNVLNHSVSTKNIQL